MIFQYVEFLGLTEERIFRPMIPISLKANGESIKTYSLIDSGCDYTILPIEIAGETCMLGQKGFLDQLKVALDWQNKRIDIRR